LDSSLASVVFLPGDPTGTAIFVKQLGGPVNGIIIGDPSCAATGQDTFGTGEVSCGVIGMDSRLWGLRFGPFALGSDGIFVDMTGATGPLVAGSPSCIPRGQSLICGVRGMDSALWVIRFNVATKSTSGLRSLGSPDGKGIIGDPSCAATGSEDATCAVVGSNGSLWGIRFNPNNGNPSPLGFKELGKPIDPATAQFEIITPNFVEGRTWGCSNTATEEVTCLLRTKRNQLFGIRFDPGTNNTTSGFVQLPALFDGQPLGLLTGKPSCIRVRPGDFVNCFFKAMKNNVFGVIFDPRQQIPINPILKLNADLGPIISDPSCATTLDQRLGICAVIDGGNDMWAIPAVE